MSDPASPEVRDAMHHVASAIDEVYNGQAGNKPKVAFVLLTANFGDIQGGRVNYISNGDRASTVAMLREYLARLEGRYVEAEQGPKQ